MFSENNNFKYQILKELKEISNEEELISSHLNEILSRLSILKTKTNNLERIILEEDKETIVPIVSIAPIYEKRESNLESREIHLEPEIINNNNNNGWEINLGIKWLSRLGIIAVLIGLTLALSYSFQHFFTKEIKILTFNLLAVILFFVGNKLFTQYRILGRVLQAGGIALGYLTIYASFFFEATQLFENIDFIGYGALFLYIGFILFMAEKMSSRLIAGLAFAFGYFTATFVNNEAWAFIPSILLNLACFRLQNIKNLSWKHLDLICLFGSLIVYVDNSSGAYSSYFLYSSFAIFHLVNFFTNTSINNYLFLINNFSFYLVYKSQNPESNGVMELTLSIINLISYLYYLKFKYEKNLIDFALITGLFFLGLGIMICFKENHSISVLILSGLALIMGLLTKKSINSKIYYVFSILFLGISFLKLFIYLFNNNIGIFPALSSKIILLSHIAWVTAIALYLQDYIYINLSKTKLFRINLILSNLALFYGCQIIANEEYRTLIWALNGVLFLVLGFILKKRQYRYTGLIWFLLSSLHLLFIDINQFEIFYKILAFTLFGLCLLFASYCYSILEKKLSKAEMDE